ncbi:antifreeze protein [Pontibaca salina]|uniref:Antifreeze protein n=1 Tax=Pontibaca salina TaxID=2795731 RepID=A0A934HRQ0_9RHOB|nr:antifreeze protein [Pontibaca salina]MBI6630527.1 antifreeze protein [Pontibaca salina]
MFDMVARSHDMIRLCWNMTLLAQDAQYVMSMRIMGLSGGWSVPRSENRKMVEEKLPAFTEGMIAGTVATMTGTGPEKALQAAIAPMSKKARANRKRLAKRGPR